MVTLEAKQLNSFSEKSKGLLAFPTPVSVFFTTHFGIHTFLMKYPIDVIILDKQNTVVALRENMQPNSIFLWNPLYEKVLEMPKGTIHSKSIRKGDNISLLLT